MPNYCNFCKSFNKNQQLKRCTKCLNVAYCNSECQRNDWNEHQRVCVAKENDPIGFPFIISAKKSSINEAYLRDNLINYAKNFVQIMSVNNNQSDEYDDNDQANVFNYNLYKNFGVSIKTNQKQPAFKTLNELVNYIKSNNEKHQIYTLKLLWNNDVKLNVQICDYLNLHSVVSNNIKLNSSTSSDYTCLDECLKLFTKSEKLTPDNPWYCPKCKQHQEATKQIYLWKLPKYLIIILKRFQAHKEDTSNYPEWAQSKYGYFLNNRVQYEKLNTLIDFPLYDLDMSKYIYDPLNANSKANENVYDLYAVINHLGDSLYSGHYTAFARCHNDNDTLTNSLGRF